MSFLATLYRPLWVEHPDGTGQKVDDAHSPGSEGKSCVMSGLEKDGQSVMIGSGGVARLTNIVDMNVNVNVKELREGQKDMGSDLVGGLVVHSNVAVFGRD